MSARKPAEIKKRQGSSNVPRLDSAAAQISLVAPAGLPSPPPLLDGDDESISLYNQLGAALMKYEQLYQNVDSLTLAMAAKSYKRYSFCSLIANDPEQCFIEEPKSHCALDPETGMPQMTIKEHPAIKCMRDAQTDFFQALKVLGLDLKGRAAIMVQMTMIKALHGNNASSHPASKFFINMEAG